MAINLPGKTAIAVSRHPIFSRLRLLLSLGILGLLALCLVSFWATRDVMTQLPSHEKKGNNRGSSKDTNAPVDVTPWQTAQTLAALAVTSKELDYAREAEHLADHEVDQAFASALRQASTRQHVLTGDALRLSKKMAQLQQLVKQDQARAASLSEAAKSPGTSAASHTGSVIQADDLDVAKAQLGLDSDELVDAQQDLARAVGDDRSRIQEELTAHESAMRQYDAQVSNATPSAVTSTEPHPSLLKLFTAWFNQRTRYAMIQQAMQRAHADALALTARHNQLENEANAASSLTPAGSPSPEPSQISDPTSEKSARVSALNNRALQRQLLGIYDDQIDTQQQLASVYDKWSARVLLQHRIVQHLLLQSFALVAFILLCVVVIEALVFYFVDRPALDRRRMHTLRTLFKIGIQVAGVLLIALIVFGVPSHMPTIIGFTTAGMTVVLQDFILAFLGWFILMGRNGIRLGDWVEINGIGGEVVETGLFRTVMLESGNWTDKGHPTGRRITLMNSFAIKGQYFNFSTVGQWMWDEITLTIPTSEDTYRMIELIHKAVLKDTENDSRLAEQEWKRVARQKGSGKFSVAASIDMRPGLNGINIIVRYVTRASERFEVRNRLYQFVIDLMQKLSTVQSSCDPVRLAPSTPAAQERS